MLKMMSSLATVQFSFELLLFSLLACLASSNKHYTFRDTRQAEYVRGLNSYDFVIPSRVTPEGAHISHSLHPNIRRKKRSVENEFSQDSGEIIDHTVHYKVNVENKSIYLKVKPNYKLFLPSLVIERRNSTFKNVSDSVFNGVDPTSDHCHFIGEVLGETSSTVALEVCNGLTGLLRTGPDTFFIEPIRGHRVSEESGHPHIVYKHSSLPPNIGLNNLHHDPPNHNTSPCDAEGNKGPSKEDEEYYESEAAKHRESHRRKKRSISIERHIEAMVVVDPAMVEYYKNEDVKTYVLTIMNMVATLFHDASIGNALNLVVVRMVLLEEHQEDLTLIHHADKSLRSFCRWQKNINFKDDDHPNHHDVAILLTRINICTRLNEPCSTLGLAQVPGICLPHKSCNINEDTGLPLAYTVAHELGHNFGMTHDSVRNGCEMKDGEEFLYVMSAQLIAVNVPMKWSQCSNRAITKFIDRGWAYCLDDEPAEFQHKEFQYPIIPPGTMYDADHQCRLVYGPEAALCEGVEEEMCSTLWCRHKNKCTTKLEAAAEGTICGQNKWCFNGDCVEIGERPLAINGNWGEWSSWSECSRTCGAGISTVERHCENPPPSNGGKYCIGERKRYRICNTDPCPEDTPNFVTVQCSEFDYIPYRNKLYQWEPVDVVDTPCQLHCKPKNRFFSVLLKDMVTDGTPCTPGKRDMCISGRCRHVACDWQIDSNAREDRCGVCHGDGSTCETIKDQYNETQGLGYVEATVIPREARNIRIEEVAGANNYLAVRDNQGKYLLNGHWFIQWSGDYEMAGTIAHYERQGNKETVEASGPLKEPIHVMLLLQSPNPGVIFEYTVPKENITETRQPEFRWKYMDWTHCTSSCGGGSQRSQVVCEELEAGLVEDIYCNSSNKPDDRQRACNLHLCPAKWWAGAWQHCSVTCGTNGVHQRTVICVRSLGQDEQIALEDKNCEGQEKPTEMEPCHRKEPCPGTSSWVVGPWSKCHGNPCDRQHRSVLCEDPVLGCDESSKPGMDRPCSNLTCGVWGVENWSDCTRTCGGGIKQRRVRCSGGDVCNEEEKPASEMLCNNIDCPVTTTVKTTTTTSTAPVTTTSATSVVTSTAPVTAKSALSTGRPMTTSESSIVRELPLPIEEDESDIFVKSNVSANLQNENSLVLETNNERVQNGNNSPINNEVNVDLHISESSDLNTDISEDVGIEKENANVAELPVFSIMEGGIEEDEKNNDENDNGEDGSDNSHQKVSTSLDDNDRSDQNSEKQDTIHTDQGTELGAEDTTTNEGNSQGVSGSALPHREEPKNFFPPENIPELPYRGHRQGPPSDEMPRLPPINSGQRRIGGENMGIRKFPNIPIMKKVPNTPPQRPLAKVTETVYEWKAANWTECSRVCGGGIQTRTIYCVNKASGETVPNNLCKIVLKPNAIDRCNSRACSEWEGSEWSICSATCGSSVKMRTVTCPEGHICDPELKPKEVKSCELPPCLAWVHGQWSRCSQTCGGGEQVRLVQCINITSQQRGAGCPALTKPEERQKCNTDICPDTNHELKRHRCTRDKMSHQICRALRRMNQCPKLYVRVKCCLTCNIRQWRGHRPNRRVVR